MVGPIRKSRVKEVPLSEAKDDFCGSPTRERHHRRAAADEAEAAARLGLNQPKVSALRNYKLEGFSVERLLTLLNALDRDIDIVIRRSRGTPQRGCVLSA